MPTSITRARKHRLNRRTNLQSNQPQPAAPIRILFGGADALILTMTFDQPVSLNGVPGFTTDVPGATPVSAEKTAADTVAITFSASIAEATNINIGFQDPAIRNASGGFVISTKVTL